MTLSSAEALSDPAPTPAAPGLPIVGSLLGMSRDPAAFLVRCYRELGPVFRVRLPGRSVTVLTGPDLARFMGSRDGQAALSSQLVWSGMNGEYGAEKSVISVDGAEHRQLREVMRRGYSREALQGRFDDLVAITDQCLARDWVPGQRVPVVRSLQRLVVSQLGTLLTGNAPLDYVDDLQFTLNRILSVHVTGQRPALVLKSPRYRRAMTRVLGLGDRMVTQHRANRTAGGGERLLVEALLKARDATPEVLTSRDLSMALIGPYIAGLDTVANTLGGLLYLVLRHPDALRRMRVEADAVLRRPHLDDTVLEEMPSVQGAVQETMRLYPIAIAQPRTAAMDFRFADHLIRAGETVYCAVGVPHFLEEFFPDPMRFDIDRYTPQRREHARPGAYSPFGRGPHTCLGKGIADVQLTLTAALLVHRLDLSFTSPGYVLRRKVAPTPGPAASFRLRVDGARVPGTS
jgi:cytochrome P450